MRGLQTLHNEPSIFHVVHVVHVVHLHNSNYKFKLHWIFASVNGHVASNSLIIW